MVNLVYKYRSLDNFQFLLDIIVNKRLYAARFDEMNDPMEGVYAHQQKLNELEHESLKKALEELRFCSLSKLEDDQLMWAHYANGARGCVLEVELSEKCRFEDVSYSGPSNIESAYSLDLKERAVKILTCKSECWDYEQEVRAFATKGYFIELVSVRRVIIGEKADKTAASVLRQVIEKIDPSIEVIDRRNKPSDKASYAS